MIDVIVQSGRFPRETRPPSSNSTSKVNVTTGCMWRWIGSPAKVIDQQLEAVTE